MKRVLIVFFTALVVISMALDVSAHQESPRLMQRGMRLTTEQQKTILAVQPWLARKTKTQILSSASRLVNIHSSKRHSNLPLKANPSGSRIQGWRTSDDYGDRPSGWYELGVNGSEKLLWEYHDPDWVNDGWSEEPDFPFNSGFWRNGKVYGFHAEMLLYWLVWGHGMFTLDGEISDYEVYGDDLDLQDFSTYVLSCAYDSDNDKVYAYTLNADASAYMLQSINPDTWEFSPINTNVDIEDICVGFCYNPIDKKFYGMIPDGRLVTLDVSSGKVTQVAKYNLPVTTTIEGMVYSPLDKQFIFVYSDGNGSSVLYTIDPMNFNIEKRADLVGSMQYRILVTPDTPLDPKAPLTPEIISFDFVNGNLSGTASIRIPVKTFDGSALSGSLKVFARVDGKLYNEITAIPGSIVEIPFKNISEGNRNFSFSVATGTLESAEAQQTRFIGFDTPKPPQNIRLEAGSLLWDIASEGINGGYIDAAALTYNVYLNGEKINQQPISGTSFDFDMPEETFRKYVAQVEAINHGHVSDRGFSNDIKYGNPFSLPFSMAPTITESELVKVISVPSQSLENWIYSGDNIYGNYFTCNTMSYDGSEDKWIFLPGIMVPQTDNLIEISFEIKCQGYEENNENIAVGFGEEQKPESVKIAGSFEDLNNEDWKKLTVWCFPTAGVRYLGFKTVANKNSNCIMLRRISVKVSDRPSTTPAGVENLKATALPKGELKARVNFNLPTCDVAGQILTDSHLTVKVTTAAESKTVNGIPGSMQTVEIATVNGMNTITVSAYNSSAGIESSTTVFTGVDVPRPINNLCVSNSRDYRSLHLEWDAPTEGANGGYVDPASINYIFYVFNEETYEWEINRELGSVTSYDYVPESLGEGINVAQLAILTRNDIGDCGTIRVANAPVGQPYTLPMKEVFNENEYQPKFGDHPDETYKVEWGYVGDAYPYWVSKPTPYGDAAYVAQGLATEKARIVMPAFSTEGVDAAGMELPIWCGPQSGEVRVYVRAFGLKPELIGSFHDVSEDGWAKHRFHLPAKFLGQKWVNLIIDAVFNEDGQTAGFGQFKIQTFCNHDIAITAIGAPAFPVIGSPTEITAKIENSGLQPADVPQMQLTVSRGETTLAEMAMERVDGNGTLSELASASFRAVWTPAADSEGNIKFVVRTISPDMDSSNDFMQADAIVGKGNNAVVTDLRAKEDVSGVSLNWTDPTVETGKEGFESMAPFSYGDRIGDFTFHCLDNSETMYFGNFRFPYDMDKKAWQVIGEKEISEIMEENGIDNSYLVAASGNCFLAAFTPLSYYIGAGLVADRWIVSPELKPGSKFSFMMTPGITGKIEYVQVLASKTDDSPDSFEVIDEHQLLTSEWRKYEYTLSQEAKYFAIRYYGDSDNSYFVLVDEIEYVPEAESPVLEGFDIYRDGTLIAETVKTRGSWIDSYKPQGKPTYYNIKPVVRRNGVLTRGLMSNTASTTGQSSIGVIEADADPDAEYFNLQGIRVENPVNGIFIKKEGVTVSKVLIR